MANGGISIPIRLDMDVSDIKKQGQALGNIFERAVLNKNTRAKALDNLEKQIIKARDEMKLIQSAITSFMTTPVRTKIFDDAIKQAKDYKVIVKEAIAEIKKQRPQFAKFSDKDIMQAFLQPGKHHMVQTPNFGMVNLSKTLKDLQTAQKLCNDLVKTGKAFEINQGAIDLLKTELIESEDKVRDLLTQMQQMSLGNGNWIQSSLQPLNNFNNEIMQTATAISTAFGPYVQIATVAVQGLVAALRLVVKGLSAIGKAAISAFKPLVSLAELAAKAIGKMFDNIKKHNETTMKNLWRNILRYGIGVRSMYFLIRKLRAAIGDVINELARQIPEVNAQMSAFQTALNGLKGSLATAFQPILTAVLPALTALINAVSRAIAVVGKFIALLTGQNFVYAATATQVDYAASLDKTGKSAKKAKKELEGYLSPIDEINKYQSKKDDDNSGGGGGGGDAAPYTLKKVPIEDWIKDFWDRLRKAWMRADFFDLGKELGDKIAKALASIPWDKIKNVARKLGKSLATFLNGVMYGEFDGKSLGYWIGHTFAQAINTGFEFANQFAKNFDWGKLGQTVVDTIKGVFENLDWNVITETLGELGLGIGKTIAEIFKNPDVFAEAGDALGRAVNALIDMVYNFFNQQSGKDIGTAIATFINSAVGQFDAKDFANMCNVIMITLLDSLISAIERTKWDQIGIKIAQVISSIDFIGIFKRYGKLASNIINAILDLLESFLDTLTPNKLKEIGEGIASAINEIDFQPERMGKVMNRLFQALLDIAKTAVHEVDWNKLGNDIGTVLKNIDWKGIISGATEILTGIKDGLSDLLESALRSWFGDFATNCILGYIDGIKFTVRTLLYKILGPFITIIDAIKALFGIASPSKVFFSIGDDVVQGFINGIQSIVRKAQEIWEKLKTKTVEIYEDIKNKVVEKVINLRDKAVELYEEIKTKLIEKVTNLKNEVVKKYEEIKTDVTEKITALKDKVVELYEEIKTNITEKVESAKKTVVDTWEGMKTSVIQIFEDMWSGIKTVINSILGGVEKMANGIIKGLNFAIGAINNLSFDVPDWIPEIGGKTIGFSIPTLNEVSIPRLAQGAVIPPNKEFMAVLGDQKSGANIETPLATMIEAFNTALKQNGNGRTEINFLLPDRRKVAQYVLEGGRLMQTSTGRNPFDLL